MASTLAKYRILNIYKEDLKTVYNFIVNQAETVINLSLTSTPVKGPQTEREEAVKPYFKTDSGAY